MCFSPNTPVSSTNETDSHDITEILLKVALNTINLTHIPVDASLHKNFYTVKLTIFNY